MGDVRHKYLLTAADFEKTSFIASIRYLESRWTVEQSLCIYNDLSVQSRPIKSTLNASQRFSRVDRFQWQPIRFNEWQTDKKLQRGNQQWKKAKGWINEYLVHRNAQCHHSSNILLNFTLTAVIFSRNQINFTSKVGNGIAMCHWVRIILAIKFANYQRMLDHSIKKTVVNPTLKTVSQIFHWSTVFNRRGIILIGKQFINIAVVKQKQREIK